MATYLVTGGCGFIGSHLCKALLSRGAAVRVLDDLSTGSLASLPAAAAFIQGDVADPQPVRQALAGVNGCFHLAAVASVELSNRDWLRTHRTNLSPYSMRRWRLGRSPSYTPPRLLSMG